MSATAAEHSERMQCMEVWGGNTFVDRNFATPGLQLWLRSSPHKQAASGGDVYFISSCASGRITRVLLADVSGHGSQAAARALQLRDLMRRNVNVISQTGFAREMNRQFADQSATDTFATALLCTFFAPTRSLQFSNAGHPTPLIYRNDSKKWFLANECSNGRSTDKLADIPFGVAKQADYSLYETKLEPADMLLCVSDAFTESRDADGEMLGVQGFYKIVRELRDWTPRTFVSRLIDHLSQLHRDNLHLDDATVILMCADGSRVSLTGNLAAPFRWISPVRDNTQLRFEGDQSSADA